VKLIVGLGNPGPRYAVTRHNVGFRVIDEIAARQGLTLDGGPADALVAKVRSWSEPAWIVKPLTMMNLSGHAVADLARFYQVGPGDILVIVDEAQLPLGRLRARRGGSAGGHNGLKSVIAQLGTDRFPRLRIGVGRGDARRDLADHVLAKFERDEQPDIDAAIAKAADASEVFVNDGIEAVMNRFNAKEKGDEAPLLDQENR
jgi:peptidyl-tRNA hydrolase, PTH1 family